jgi:hypothetical protein
VGHGTLGLLGSLRRRFLFVYSPPPSRYDPPSVFQMETEQLEMLFFDEWCWIDWKIISSINKQRIDVEWRR